MLNENSGPNGNLGWDDARLAAETAAAMRDLAGTVTDAPPLLLKTAPGELGFRRVRPSRQRWHGRRLRTWLVPAAAALTIAAVAIALVLIRNIPNGREPTPAASPSPTTAVTPPGVAGVPEYYVAWMQADRPYLVVGNTLTGKQYATVPSPPGVRLEAVYGGSADNRTWVVQGTRLAGPGVVTEWYVLTINADPAAENPLQMGSAGIPVRENPAGAALSPDGKDVAVAVNGAQPSLRVYSLRTGALLHSWTAPSGKFAAANVASDAWQYTQLTLRWSADGKRLGFAWNATDIRVIDASAPNGDLLPHSTSLLAIGRTYSGIGSAFICDAWQGWSLVDGGSGVLCAGGEDMSGVSRPVGDKPLKGSVGFVLEQHFPDGSSETGVTAAVRLQTSKAVTGDAAYLGWANADGTVAIGSQMWQGHERFGIFRGHNFTPLPTLPLSFPPPVGVLSGTDAW